MTQGYRVVVALLCVIGLVNRMAKYSCCSLVFVFLFQAEDGIRYLVRSRGLGDVYKRQEERRPFSRQAIGRENFIAKVKEWREENGNQIMHQLSLIHI